MEKGAQVLVLSDRCDGLNAESPAIPAMLAVGAVHHHLIQCGLRMNASIVSDNATTFSTHHLACLVGYGASAVCPHLALESVRQFHSAPRTQTLMKNGKLPPLDMEDMQQNFAAVSVISFFSDCSSDRPCLSPRVQSRPLGKACVWPEL